jgi:hypothetical protein
MKKEIITVINQDDNFDYYYGDWHIGGEFENFIEDWQDKRVKITLEVIDETVETVEETVTITYKELFNRATDSILSVLRVNTYYLNEGGNPHTLISIPKSSARDFMGEDEFNARKND